MSRIKRIHAIDVHIGSRLRLRRKQFGFSQKELGQRLGVTAQQIQKYEQGIDRVSAAALFALASEMNASVTFFFTGLRAKSRSRRTKRSQNITPN
jgi:transcriptional regulator with XRE-family HTH domain